MKNSLLNNAGTALGVLFWGGMIGLMIFGVSSDSSSSDTNSSSTSGPASSSQVESISDTSDESDSSYDSYEDEDTSDYSSDYDDIDYDSSDYESFDSSDPGYTNTYGNYVPSPTYENYGNATATCSDGTYSYSQSRSGTCSHHGGVSSWH